jgi:hypothetical protein
VHIASKTVEERAPIKSVNIRSTDIHRAQAALAKLARKKQKELKARLSQTCVFQMIRRSTK